jgi:hypothetical protein
MKMEAAFNRRMRKTARTVVWEGAGAQSPAPDPIYTAAAGRPQRALSILRPLASSLFDYRPSAPAFSVFTSTIPSTFTFFFPVRSMPCSRRTVSNTCSRGSPPFTVICLVASS